MLLLIEWHPKSINNPLSFSGVDDTDATSWTNSRTLQPGSTPESLTSSTSQQRHSMAGLLDELNIVAPAHRSMKMSRMLLCNATGIAQDGCCFELDSPSYATPTSSSSDESLKQQWNQLLCVFLYLADETLATRLGLDTLLAEKATDAVRSRFSITFANDLPDGALWESYYELSLELGKARDLLKSTRHRNDAPDVAKLLPELQHVDRALHRWKSQHSYAESTDSTLLKACVDIECDYSVMYCFAPAVQAATNYGAAKNNASTKENATGDQLELSVFASKATEASRQILTTVVEILLPAGLVSYLPIRCWLCIFAAYLHLLKTTLLANPSLNHSDREIQLFRDSIAAIRQGSPDDSHMAVRHAKFLEILRNASLHSSRVGSPASTRDTHGENPVTTGVAEDEDAFPVSFFSALDFPAPAFGNALEELGGLADWADGSFGWLRG
ncbi:uncharacterized protein F5Z01DRAFT_385094 [Emericellopsis atlantica]|uniref:Uncharacterized protein n=1 Tax=Emericellopsis atlantica TaxID=2614577 RepID=A0A9P8CRV8_9HYPO|nr:uncharacterized protein F5Z01DRAFT_385094 [Emericellopsis atlantica]KAG9257399.1 hypothetical protein F5Z01DRAFT_385094 [Emericellopsis atlantica]